MRKPIPLIHADEAALQQRLHHEYDGHKKPRWHMLYLRATGQAQGRQGVARRPGVHRHTIRRWLARYAAGGLEA